MLDRELWVKFWVPSSNEADARSIAGALPKQLAPVEDIDQSRLSPHHFRHRNQQPSWCLRFARIFWDHIQQKSQKVSLHKALHQTSRILLFQTPTCTANCCHRHGWYLLVSHLSLWWSLQKNEGRWRYKKSMNILKMPKSWRLKNTKMWSPKRVHRYSQVDVLDCMWVRDRWEIIPESKVVSPGG